MKVNFLNAEEVRNSSLFRHSNKYWNMYGYNSRANIGHLMKIINKMRPISLDDWVHDYTQSGKEYERLLKKGSTLDPAEYGRSESQLRTIASDFRKDLMAHGLRIDFDTAYRFVLIRVLYETWIGYSREKRVYNMLKTAFNGAYEVRHTEPSIDIEMAVDFEVLKDGQLILGLQVKGNNSSEATLKMNKRKNARYISQYGVPVFYVSCSRTGIENMSELSKELRRA